MTTLQNEMWTLDLAPECGGSVRSLQWQGQHILRPGPERTPEAEWDARSYAAFPMVPHIGRITDGRFTWLGQKIQLPANMPPEPHAIHGFGWQTPWYLSQTSDTSVCLEHSYPGGAWPWPYRARQTFILDSDSLLIALELTNLGDSTMPGGLGWHPYFPKEGARLRINTERVWLAATPSMPATSEPVSGVFDFRGGQSVSDIYLDHAFSIGAGTIDVGLKDVTLTLDHGSQARAAIIYAPHGEDFFCAEPTTQIPDAVNLDLEPAITGLRALQPGATLSLQIKLTAKTR